MNTGTVTALVAAGFGLAFVVAETTYFPGLLFLFLWICGVGWLTRRSDRKQGIPPPPRDVADRFDDPNGFD